MDRDPNADQWRWTESRPWTMIRGASLRMSRAAAITVLCLSLSACGGGDGDDSAAGTDFQRAIEAEAQEQAESLLLTLADFPDGWRASPAEEEDEESEAAFRECAGVDYSALTKVGEADSDDFATGETAQASSEADVFESEETAAAAVAEFTRAFAADETTGCMSEYLGQFEDDQIEITEVELGELSFTPPAGVAEAGAWQMAITLEGKPGTDAAGISAIAYSDFVLLREGAATASMTTQDVGTPFDPMLRDELIAAVAERLTE